MSNLQENITIYRIVELLATFINVTKYWTCVCLCIRVDLKTDNSPAIVV